MAKQPKEGQKNPWANIVKDKHASKIWNKL